MIRNRLFGARRPYTERFFRQLDEWQEESYSAIAQWLIDRFQSTSVLDLGCGTGQLLVEFRKAGVARCAGVEFSKYAVRHCRNLGLDVVQADLGMPLKIDDTIDLSICLEVAEHLPPECADQLVANLAGASGHLVFSAATPGQGGHHHVNEQPEIYWLEKFNRYGWQLDSKGTDEFRRDLASKNVARWYSNNVMILQRVQ